MREKLHRGCGSVCSDLAVLLVIGGVERSKVLDPECRLRAICMFCIVGVTGI